MGNRIFGKKLGMTRYFLEEGKSVPVTMVQAGPCIVIQKKTIDKDGYEAIQVGFEEKKESRVNKPLKGHQKAAGDKCFQFLKEIRVKDTKEYELGQPITADIFQIGDIVTVSGKSIGRGFAGVIKRHGFSGGRWSHGSRSHRVPGSIGNSTTPGRVVKGRKLPGRHGFERITVKNLKVLDVRPDINLIAIKGPLPGSDNSIIEICRL